MESISFTRMDQGTAEEYLWLEDIGAEHRRATQADNLLHLLKMMQGPTLGYQVDRYVHSLQTATRAQRDGASEETVVAALLHDIGDIMAPDNHSAAAAAVLRPYVSDETHWVIKHHGVFQGYYYWHHIGGDRDARERYRGHPHFQACANFCEKWDQTSFDPAYDTMPLEAFRPMVQRIFAREPFAAERE